MDSSDYQNTNKIAILTKELEEVEAKFASHANDKAELEKVVSAFIDTTI